MKKIALVTGAGGFIGANLTRRLFQSHWKVYGTIRKKSVLWRLTDIQTKISIIPGLLDDRKKLVSFLKRVRPFAIFHLATYGAYPDQSDTASAVETNIGTFIRLLDAVKLADQSLRIVVTGSSSEYGKKRDAMKETDVLEPNSMYAATKAAQTHIAQAYAARFGLRIKILRLFNVYGPFEKEGRLVRNAIEAALAGKTVELSDRLVKRDFIHTDDVSDALIAAAIQHSHWDGQIFNIGTGRETTIESLARMVIKYTGSNSRIATGSYRGRPWDSKHWKADMKKTSRHMRWKAKIGLSDGLKKTIAWYTSTRT